MPRPGVRFTLRVRKTGRRAQRTIHMQDGRVKSDVVSESRRIRTPLPRFAV